MGRVRANGHDSNKHSDISPSKAGISSMKKVKRSILDPSTPVRRSGRLNGKSSDFPSSTRDSFVEKDKTEEDRRSSEIEQNNKARENGTNAELSSKSSKENKKRKMRLELGTPPRRSERTVTETCDSDSSTSQENKSGIVENCSHVEKEAENNSGIVENCSHVEEEAENNSEIVENCSHVEEEAKVDEVVAETPKDGSTQLARISENKVILHTNVVDNCSHVEKEAENNSGIVENCSHVQEEAENNSEIVDNCSHVEEEVKVDEVVAETPEDESTQLARISENKAILASLGLGNSIRMLENLVFPPKTTQKDAKVDEEPNTDNQVTKILDYESIRNARISENKARLEALGIARSLKEMQTVMSPKTSTKCKSKSSTAKKAKTEVSVPSRRSNRLKRTNSSSDDSSLQALSYESDEGLVDIMDRKKYPMSERCTSKARGSIYDPVIGICCHFCRQKKLCGEEDCKRCGDRDINQPCIGKTECSVCHSTNGVLCRACLKVRYGEEMEEVRSKGDWMCPHCVEEKGINPYWICNSSFCLKRRKMVPTGIAIHQARAEGFLSVAHMIMDKLKQKAIVL